MRNIQEYTAGKRETKNSERRACQRQANKFQSDSKNLNQNTESSTVGKIILKAKTTLRLHTSHTNLRCSHTRSDNVSAEELVQGETVRAVLHHHRQSFSSVKNNLMWLCTMLLLMAQDISMIFLTRCVTIIFY